MRAKHGLDDVLGAAASGDDHGVVGGSAVQTELVQGLLHCFAGVKAFHPLKIDTLEKSNVG